jgi:hypothetical protein
MEAESENKDEDTILKHGYGYDFGDWKSYPTPELATASKDHKEFAVLFNSDRKQIIVSRTCYDMNFTLTLAKSVKLLILTADGAPSRTSWKDKIAKARVCYCDASYACTIMSYPDCKDELSERIVVPSFIEDKIRCVFVVYYGDCHEKIKITDDCCCC